MPRGIYDRSKMKKSAKKKTAKKVVKKAVKKTRKIKNATAYGVVGKKKLTFLKPQKKAAKKVVKRRKQKVASGVVASTANGPQAPLLISSAVELDVTTSPKVLLGNLAKRLGDIGFEFASTQTLRLNDISRNPEAALMLSGSETHVYRALYRVSEVRDKLAIMEVPDDLSAIHHALSEEAVRLVDHFTNHL